MIYRRLIILLMLFIMAFPLIYSTVCHDKAVYSVFSDEEKRGDSEDGEKECKDDVTKYCQNFFPYTIESCTVQSKKILPSVNSAIPTEHFAKVQSPPPDFI